MGRSSHDLPGGYRTGARPAPLASVARMVRELHDLTSGTSLAGDHEVVCHNDLDPRNTVYTAADTVLIPRALIDWDLAGPGDRVHDVAHVCWTFTLLGDPGIDAGVVVRRMRTVLDAYEWGGSFSQVVDGMLWWQERCWRGIEAGADAGDASLQALREHGVVARVRHDLAWTHRWLRSA